MKEEKFIVDMGGFKTTIEIVHIVLSDDDPEVWDWELNPIQDYWVCEVSWRDSWEGYDAGEAEKKLYKWSRWWWRSQCRQGTKRQYEIIDMKRPKKAIPWSNSQWLMDMEEDHSTKQGYIYNYGSYDSRDLVQPFLEKDKKELYNLLGKCGRIL